MKARFFTFVAIFLSITNLSLHAQLMLRPDFEGVTTLPPVGDGFGTFNIVVNFVASQSGVTCTTPTASESAAFASAESTWESIVKSYKEPVGLSALTINSCIGPIDGPSGILGSAGPTNGSTAPGGSYLYASAGQMTFDSADTPGLGASLNDVILHEMGHVMGVGTLWSSSGVGAPGFQELYVNGTGQYTGAEGLAAYKDEFNQPAATFVPVELGGGGGTANGHWNEVDGGGTNTGIVSNLSGQDMRFELMTGWLNAPTFISSLTKSQFGDLGYITAIPEPSGFFLFGLLGCAGMSYSFRSKAQEWFGK